MLFVTIITTASHEFCNKCHSMFSTNSLHSDIVLIKMKHYEILS